MEDFEIQRIADQASEALNQGHPAKALALLDQLVAAAPDHANYRYWQCRALMGLERFEDALEAARRAVELAPGFIAGYMPLAWAAAHVGRIQEGQVAFQRALAASSRRAWVLAEYAMFLAAFRGPRVAVEAAQEAINADPNQAEAWVALGWARYRMHQYDEAEKGLRRALELEPDNSRAMVAMTELLNSTGRPAQAKALAALLSYHPEAVEAAEGLRRKADRHYLFLPPNADGIDVTRPLPRPAEADRASWRDRVHVGVREVFWAIGLVLMGLGFVAAFRSNQTPLSLLCFMSGLTIVAYLCGTKGQ